MKKFQDMLKEGNSESDVLSSFNKLIKDAKNAKLDDIAKELQGMPPKHLKSIIADIENLSYYLRVKRQ